ncbi:MAG: hypothetical protein H0X37_23335 [Herpetosiphonaceae bacterium]|nr:hypothetical protein [Herpetosiphonaceae bacterium]
MAEGFIYRCTNATIEQLRRLIDGQSYGLCWSPAQLLRSLTDDALLGTDEGRASIDETEVRWRRVGQGYGILVLSLQPQQLDGFTELQAEGGPWTTSSMPSELPRAANNLTKPAVATLFLAPNGAPQFVALISNPQSAGR